MRPGWRPFIASLLAEVSSSGDPSKPTDDDDDDNDVDWVARGGGVEYMRPNKRAVSSPGPPIRGHVHETDNNSR